MDRPAFCKEETALRRKWFIKFKCRQFVYQHQHTHTQQKIKRTTANGNVSLPTSKPKRVFRASLMVQQSLYLIIAVRVFALCVCTHTYTHIQIQIRIPERKSPAEIKVSHGNGWPMIYRRYIYLSIVLYHCAQLTRYGKKKLNGMTPTLIGTHMLIKRDAHQCEMQASMHHTTTV